MVTQENSFTPEKRNTEDDIRKEKTTEKRRLPSGEQREEWPEVVAVTGNLAHRHAKRERARKNKNGRDTSSHRTPGSRSLTAHSTSTARNKANIHRAKKPTQRHTCSEPGSRKPSSDTESDLPLGRDSEQEQKRGGLSLKRDRA